MYAQMRVCSMYTCTCSCMCVCMRAIHTMYVKTYADYAYMATNIRAHNFLCLSSRSFYSPGGGGGQGHSPKGWIERSVTSVGKAINTTIQ